MASGSERVRSECRDGVLTLVLDRPDKRNAIDGTMVEALSDALRTADHDADVRVVVIRGAGPDFCAGADLAELLASVDDGPAENARQARRLGEIFTAIRELPKPVIAAVHGRALAGGCGLATACDLIVAHADARFGYPEITRGFVPAMVMAVLRRIVGERVAFDLVATGRILSAAEARDLGMVSRVAPAERFDQEVAAMAQHFASASASALALIKRQLYELDGRSFREGIRLGADVNATARQTPDFREAVSRFFQPKAG